jgi:hypothetical protein
MLQTFRWSNTHVNTMIIIIIITNIRQYDHPFCKSVLQVLFKRMWTSFTISLFTPPNLRVLPITWILYKSLSALYIIWMIYKIEFTLWFSSFFSLFFCNISTSAFFKTIIYLLLHLRTTSSPHVRPVRRYEEKQYTDGDVHRAIFRWRYDLVPFNTSDDSALQAVIHFNDRWQMNQLSLQSLMRQWLAAGWMTWVRFQVNTLGLVSSPPCSERLWSPRTFLADGWLANLLKKIQRLLHTINTDTGWTWVIAPRSGCITPPRRSHSTRSIEGWLDQQPFWTQCCCITLLPLPGIETRYSWR